MMKVIFFISILFFSNNVLAETIVLTSGETVEAKIINQSEKYIEVEYEGVPITYYLNEIVSVDGKGINSPKEKGLEPAADEKVKLVEELLEVTGTKRQFSDQSKQMEDESSQPDKKKQSEMTALVQRVFKDEFKFEKIYEELRKNILANFDRDKILRILKWHHSPLGVKIIESEINSNAKDVSPEEKAFELDLQTNPPSDERIDLIHRLDVVTGTSEMALNSTVFLGSQIAHVFMMADPNPKAHRQKQELENYKKVMKEQFAPSVKQKLYNSSYFTYKDISDDDLEQYVNFFESEDGKWLSGIMNGGFTKGLEKISADMDQRFMNVMPQIKRLIQEMQDKESGEAK